MQQSRLTYPTAHASPPRCNAFAEIEPSHPRKCARLEQEQRVLEYNISPSPSKKMLTGDRTKLGANQGPDEDDANASANYGVTGGPAEAKDLTASLSDTQTADAARNVIATIPGSQGF